MDNPLDFITGPIKAEFDSLVNNAKVQAQIEVLEIMGDVNAEAAKVIMARIEALKGQLQ
jgi:hypothetical protein